MDPSSYQQDDFQYNVLTFGDLEMSMVNTTQVPAQVPMVQSTAMLPPPASSSTTMTQPMPKVGSMMPTASSVLPADTTTMPPPQSHTYWASTSTSCEGESFNDSGYFSSPQTSQFTAIHSHQPSTSVGNQVGMGCSQTPPTVPSAPISGQVATPRSNWQEDFANISDEWDTTFFNNFEENLFSNMDASDFNNIVDGILSSPFKSPTGSPFQSPPQHRTAATQGLSLSPLSQFSSASAANVMLTDLKKSPANLQDSPPFVNLFSTPSPVKGLNPHTRASPMTRQRRRILQSPAHKVDVLPDHFLDMHHLSNNKMEQIDDLGVAPFHRTNSLGFTPTEGISSSVNFFDENLAQSSHPFVCEMSVPSAQSVMVAPTLQEIGNVARPKQHKKIKMESLYNLRNSPAKKDTTCHKQQNPSNQQKSPARIAQGRISVTRHSHLVDKLDSKGALRFVRARFKEALEKAVADADKVLESKFRSHIKKKQQQAEISQALVQPVAGSESAPSVPCYTQIQPPRPPAKRRQEILPKPTPDWPQRPPCKIAPKKRKR
ncbi:uncharacterized protein LOC143299764 [Babylonia areolata]|uniref:uncharacterized protein LOC143299764 n=1 Tax=Babylonia areolata TaxID=304850 RepID=UPI003FCFC476